MSVPIAVLVAHSLALGVAWGGARLGATRLPGRAPAAGHTASQFGRRLAILAILATPGVALLAGTDGWLSAWFEGVVPGFGPDVYSSLASFALFVGPVPLTAFAAYRGARTADPRRVTSDLRRDARRFLTGYLLLTGPALVVVALTPLIPDGWWLVTGLALVGLPLAIATPLLVPRLVPTRDLFPAERDRLDLPTSIPVRVVDAGRYRNALAAGVVPGLRAVFVTEQLLATLPPEETTAVLAHEVGHLRRHHILVRLGAVGLVVLPWLGATAAEIPGAFVGGLLLLVPGALALLSVMRWTERDADRYAATTADPAALARALARLSPPTDRGRLASLLAPHPDTDVRVERAREYASDERTDSTDDER